jgi:hypothetical protein
MRSKLIAVILFLLAINFCKSQQIAVFDTSMFDVNYQNILITNLDGWVFQNGNDTNWSKKKLIQQRG